MANLAAETTMTSYAKELFYINHPQLESKGQFNTKCPNNGGDTTICLVVITWKIEGISSILY